MKETLFRYQLKKSILAAIAILIYCLRFKKTVSQCFIFHTFMYFTGNIMSEHKVPSAVSQIIIIKLLKMKMLNLLKFNKD